MTDKIMVHDLATQPRRLGVGWWFAVFMVCFLLYLGTVSRGVCWQDSGWNQLRAIEGDYYRSVPLARAHVLYIAGGHLLAKISPSHMPFLFNALSSFWMAVAMANIAAIGVLLTNRRWIGLTVASMLALAHTVWWLATINESYAWVLAGFTAEIYLLICLLRRPNWKTLATLGIVSGLGLCVHNFALLPLPVYVVVACWLVARRKIPAWSLPVATVAFLAGAGVFLGMIVESATRHGAIWAIRDALTGQYTADVMNVAASGRFWKANMAISGMNFANLLIPLAIVGVVRLRARQGNALAASLIAITVIQVLFFVRYPVPDQFMFILPTLVMLGLLGCVGLNVLADLTKPRWRAILIALMLVSAVAQPIAYISVSRFVQQNIGPIRKRQLPFRNETDYWLTPWKHNKGSAEKFAELALQTAAPDGVILADGTSVYPLLVVQRLADGNKFAGVSIYQSPNFLSKAITAVPADEAPAACRAMLGGRELFVVHKQQSNFPPELARGAKLSKTSDGALYRVVWR